MMSVLSQEYATKMYGLDKRAEGFAEGKEKAARETAFRMRDMGFDNSVITQALDVSPTKLQNWFDESSSSMPQA